MPHTLALFLVLQDGADDSATSFMIPMILIGVIFWFIVIGPERKQRKKREAVLAELGKGDKVMTTGGLYGTVTQVKDDVVTLQVTDNVRLRYALSSIQGTVNGDSGKD